VFNKYTPNDEVGLVVDGFIRLLMTTGVEANPPAATTAVDKAEKVIILIPLS